MTDNTYPRYARRTPAPVEAYQWLPEDAQHTQEVLAWLMHYPKTRFIVEPSSDAVFGTKQTVGFQHNGAGWDAVTCGQEIGLYATARTPTAYTMMPTFTLSLGKGR